jgi:hypothetical protein
MFKPGDMIVSTLGQKRRAALALFPEPIDLKYFSENHHTWIPHPRSMLVVFVEPVRFEQSFQWKLVITNDGQCGWIAEGDEEHVVVKDV